MGFSSPAKLPVGDGAINVSQYSYSGTAGLALAANPKRLRVTIRNSTVGQNVFIGPTSGVTTSNGFIIVDRNYPPSTVVIEDYKGAIYCIGSGAGVVTILEEVVS